MQSDDAQTPETVDGQPPRISKSEATTVDFDRPDALVGSRLEGRFLIEKNLTESGADVGGIGVVYLATDTKLLGRKVVVKILREEALKLNDVVRKFLHEKEALTRLDHPGVVRILDSGELSDGNPYIVMEYIEGYSLRKAMRRQAQLPLHVIAHLIESFTDALGAAHSKDILHRDIKPENIMLTPEEGAYERVRLIDFGIAKVGQSQLAPETEISRAIGTILYIAPEQLIGKTDLTAAADIYSSGIVAYELITGDLPFKPASIAEMYKLQSEGVRTRPGELRRDLPHSADALIMNSLEFDPSKRPQNVREFGRLLARSLRSGEPGYQAPISVEDDQYLHSIKTEFYPHVPSQFEKDAAPMPVPSTVAVPASSTSGQVPTRPVRPRKWLTGSIGALLVFVMIGTGSFLLYRNLSSGNAPAAASAEAPAAEPTGPAITLAYYLTIQKMRNGSRYQEPYPATGMEIFESGYKFRMTFEFDSDGAAYIFNEGKDVRGETVCSTLFPNPDTKMSPSVTAGKTINTAENTFSGQPGTEVMWVIWTRRELPEMKAVMDSIDMGTGQIKPPGVATLVQFLGKHKDTPRDFVGKDPEAERTLIRGTGDILVHRFELKHR